MELLQGRFSKAVMQHLCRQGTGLFPTPHEIEFSCSCPDRALMCKHVAAVLYGIGARLDHQPGLLFRLRQVDEQALIARAATGVPLAKKGPAAAKVLAGKDLAAVFGVDLAPAAAQRAKAMPAPKRREAKKTRAPKTVQPERAPVGERRAPVPPGARMSAAQRKAVSERMTRYWAERRRQTTVGRKTKQG